SLRTVGVTHHRALGSPDFPPPATEVADGDRPAGRLHAFALYRTPPPARVARGPVESPSVTMDD
ncbi:MAG TPA: hypothetical protein VL371_14170, partial [Gemmataceae bacterium]|nr:hypothetical protein [Gemmataceae bacterium]